MQKCSCSIPGRYSDQVRGTKIQPKRLVETVRSSKSVSFPGIKTWKYLENCTARWKTSCKENQLRILQIGLRVEKATNNDQVMKGAGWMPWHWSPTKDVISCDKPRGAANEL